MAGRRKNFSAEEKVRILRRHLLEKVPVADLCDELGLNPTLFYRCQKELFENGHQAFEKDNDGKTKKLERENSKLIEKLAGKDEVIAEIMESHVALKKKLGRS